jgi:alkanesulfonate monooxygenase SsuD/methylene tetrahydromethanopterin reductase-like flavin-dependent oxidoreductase (luciferase family)
MTISSGRTGPDDIAVQRDAGQSNRVGVVMVAEVDFGAHMPLIDFCTPASLPGLKAYAHTAAGLGYRYLSANDHLLFGRPWLDGPTALAAVIEESQDMTLATTVSLPVIRGPAQLAKTLAAIDILSDGRLVVGVGPGSSARDYAAAGIPFDERWPRFGEAIPMLRALLAGDQAFNGAFYSSHGIDLEPRPAQRPTPPIWVATWGSPAGLRRVARTGDGWLASAYNTTPERFGEGLTRLAEALVKEGRAEPVPNAVGTAWLYVTEDIRSAERMLADVLAPLLNRPVEELRSLSLPIGPAEVCAERVAAFADAGAQRLFVWPLRDGPTQLELFRERVVPMLR